MRIMILAAALAFTGHAASAEGIEGNFEPSIVAVAAAEGATLHDVMVNDNGVIAIVVKRGEAAVPLSPATMDNIELLCGDPAGKMHLTLPGGEKPAVTVVDFAVHVGGKDSGYECPMPEWQADLRWVWEQRETEHKMEGEFTSDHLHKVIAQINSGNLVLFTKQRWKTEYPTYTVGDDRPYVEQALLNREGDLRVYAFQIDKVLYLVEMRLGCDALCTGQPDMVRVWHMHEGQFKAAKKTSKTKKSSSVVTTETRPDPDHLPMVCSGTCN